MAGALLLGACGSTTTIGGGSGGEIATGSGGGTISGSGGVSGSGGKGSGGTTVSGSGGTVSGSGGTTVSGSGGTTASGSGGKGSGGTTVSGSGGTTASGSGGATGTPFSFFVTSQTRLFALAKSFNGSTKGFGGDLRYGETGTGAGLRGADKICAAIAEQALPGSGSKTWRAYLSATASGSGTGAQVNAIDRIGSGPWYDRLGRLLANNTSELLYTRPLNANTFIKNDFPNEDGVPNHAPEGTQIDNHDFLTGTNYLGKLYGATATCKDWTDATLGWGSGYRPRVGHSWPRGTSGSGNQEGMAHWGSSLDESGCLPGANTVETGGPGNDGTVGSGGGYGGIYCFAIN